MGFGSFAEVVHKGHRELSRPPSAAEVSQSIYSRNMNHIIILISAFHRLPKSCQLFPGPAWPRGGGGWRGNPCLCRNQGESAVLELGSA